jgi:signal transduction histidine kinase
VSRSRCPPLLLALDNGFVRPSRTRSAITALLIGMVAAVAGIAVPLPLWVWVPLHLVGVCFTVAGAMSIRGSSHSQVGVLMVAVGTTWYLGDLQASTNEFVSAIGFCTYHLVTAVFAHLVLALPTGRLVGRLERGVIGGVYATCVVTQVARFFVEADRQPQGWGDPSAPSSFWGLAGSIGAFVSTVAVVVLVIMRWRSAGMPMRRAYVPVWASIVVIGVAIAIATTADVLDSPATVRNSALALVAFGLTAMPFTIRAGSIRSFIARHRVADLVLALRGNADPVHVRAAIAGAVGDPSLDIWFIHERDSFIDVHGSAVVGADRDGRFETPISVNGELLAVLVHDEVPPDQQMLFQAVAAAVGMSLENTRLQAETRSRLRQLEESQVRLVDVAAAERRRIQRDLHDGAQHQLLAVSMLLERASRGAEPASDLHAARSQVQETLSALRRLSRGISPPTLHQHGLAEAVEAIAECSPVPMVLDIVNVRFPSTVEAVAYFVVAESVANVYKHARATVIWVTVDVRGSSLVVDVLDDGCGGIDADAGSGLRGLAVRVDAVGGSLRAGARADGGSFVTAELPMKPAELPSHAAELPIDTAELPIDTAELRCER